MSLSLANTPDVTQENKYGRGLPRRGRERWRFLAESSVILDDADGTEEIIGALLRVVVPQFADLCVVRPPEADRARQTQVSFARPEIMRSLSLAVDWRFRGEESPSMPPPAQARVARFGEVRYVEIDDTVLRDLACDPEHLGRLRRLDPTTALAVPIKSRGHDFGLACFVTVRASGRRYAPADMPTACDLVHRLATALDRATHRQALETEVERLRSQHRRAAGHTMRSTA